MDAIKALQAEQEAISEIPFRDRTGEQKARWKEINREITRASLAMLGEGVGVLEYSSNNSGGSWWLKDEDWLKLQENGWTVHWARPAEEQDKRFPRDTDTRPYSALVHETVDGPFGSYEGAEDHRWLGAAAVSCAKAGTDANELLREWESLTGQDSADEGCNCCGRPHSFEWHDPKTGEERSPQNETVYISHGF